MSSAAASRPTSQVDSKTLPSTHSRCRVFVPPQSCELRCRPTRMLQCELVLRRTLCCSAHFPGGLCLGSAHIHSICTRSAQDRTSHIYAGCTEAGREVHHGRV
eukprot:6175928-Pleurochrysis_carterae.AAC.1